MVPTLTPVLLLLPLSHVIDPLYAASTHLTFVFPLPLLYNILALFEQGRGGDEQFKCDTSIGSLEEMTSWGSLKMFVYIRTQKRFNVTGAGPAAQRARRSQQLSTTTNTRKKATKKIQEWFSFPLHSFVWIYLPEDTGVLDWFLCTVISWGNQAGEVGRDY